MTPTHNAYGGLLSPTGSPPDVHSAQILRDNDGQAILRLQVEYGWTDAQLAGFFNTQHGIGGTWTEQTVAELKAFHGVPVAAAAPVATAGTFSCSCGKNYSITPA